MRTQRHRDRSSSLWFQNFLSPPNGNGPYHESHPTPLWIGLFCPGRRDATPRGLTPAAEPAIFRRVHGAAGVGLRSFSWRVVYFPAPVYCGQLIFAASKDNCLAVPDRALVTLGAHIFV